MKKCGNCKKWKPIKTYKKTEGVCSTSAMGWTFDAEAPGCLAWEKKD